MTTRTIRSLALAAGLALSAAATAGDQPHDQPDHDAMGDAIVEQAILAREAVERARAAELAAHEAMRMQERIALLRDLDRQPQRSDRTIITTQTDGDQLRIEIVRGEIVAVSLNNEDIDPEEVHVDDETIIIVDDDGEPYMSFFVPGLENNFHERPIGVIQAQRRRPFLGVTMSEVPEALRRQLGLEADADVVMIESVLDGFSADDAGIEPFDIIVGFSDASLRRTLGEREIGDELELVVIRGGDRRDVTIELRGRDEHEHDDEGEGRILLERFMGGQGAQWRNLPEANGAQRMELDRLMEALEDVEIDAEVRAQLEAALENAFPRFPNLNGRILGINPDGDDIFNFGEDRRLNGWLAHRGGLDEDAMEEIEDRLDRLADEVGERMDRLEAHFDRLHDRIEAMMDRLEARGRRGSD